MSLNVLINSDGAITNHAPGNYSGKPITEIIINGLFTVDHHWTVHYWNEAAEKLLNVKAEQIIGKNLWEQFADVLPVNFYSSYHKAFLQDIPMHFEEYWVEKDAWFDVVTYHFDGILSVSFKSSRQPFDLENPEQPLQQLKILTELYRFVTGITNDCLWEWNLQTDELFWIDGGHQRVFGYPIANALVPLAFWRSRIHPEDAFRVLDRLRTMIKEGTGGIWEDEYRFQRVDGEYANVHDRAHLIYNDQHIATRMIGATQDITARKRTELKLMTSEQNLVLAAKQHVKDVTQTVLRAQERERTYIGRELHDNLNQILGAAKMYVEMAKVNNRDRAMCLNKASDYIVQVIDEIRNISKAMVTPVGIMGLISSINMVLEDIRRTGPLSIEFDHKGIVEKQLDELIQLNIFRIVQEQFNNIVKHSRATHATLSLIQNTANIILTISDNGIGHDMTVTNDGVGITNIQNRAEGYGGSASIVSHPGNGFVLQVELPLIALGPKDKPVKD